MYGGASDDIFFCFVYLFCVLVLVLNFQSRCSYVYIFNIRTYWFVFFLFCFDNKNCPWLNLNIFEFISVCSVRYYWINLSSFVFLLNVFCFCSWKKCILGGEMVSVVSFHFLLFGFFTSFSFFLSFFLSFYQAFVLFIGSWVSRAR